MNELEQFKSALDVLEAKYYSSNEFLIKIIRENVELKAAAILLSKKEIKAREELIKMEQELHNFKQEEEIKVSNSTKS